MMYNSNKLADNEKKPFVSVITPVYNSNSIINETAG